MRVLLQRGLSSPHLVDGVDRVAVFNDDGVILALMWRRDDGLIALTRAGEPDFERLILEMGFDQPRVQCVSL